MWYGVMIKTRPKAKKSRQDIVLWDKKEMQRRIIEVAVALNTNLEKAVSEKQAK